MSREPIAITGLGCVTPFGCGAGPFTAALAEGQEIVQRATPWPGEPDVRRTAGQIEFDAVALLGKKGLGSLDRASRLLAIAGKEAWAHARLPAVEPARVGITVASSYNAHAAQIALDRELLNTGPIYVNPGALPFLVGNMQAANLAIRHGACGPNVTLASGSTAGLDAIARGAELLALGAADVMLTGGTEALSTPLLYALDRLELLGSDAPGRTRATYAPESTGLVVSEAAAVLVLEPAEAARSRGATVLGMIHGFATQAGPDPVAAALGSARRALAAASQPATDIGWIATGANGVPDLDQAELSSIAALFDGGPAPPIYPVKDAVGEAFSASGPLQVLAAIDSLARLTTPRRAGRLRPDGTFERAGGPLPFEAPLVLCLAICHDGVASAMVVGPDNLAGGRR